MLYLGLLWAWCGHAQLRLLNWNVAGNGLTDWSTNTPQVQAVGRVLQALAPDIVTLQEIPNENQAYLQLGAFTRTYLPGYTNVYSSGTDGLLRSAVLSRFPILRAQSHLDGVSLVNAGSSDRFTRDLFEAEIAVPDFPAPLHVFTTHLKASGDADSITRRAAEATTISNFFVRDFLPVHPGRPFVLAGDFNEDDSKPRDPALNPVPRLANAGTTLNLLNATNPATGRLETWSARFGLNWRFDYVLVSADLVPQIGSAVAYRTDRAVPLPPGLNREDGATASDHLPLLVTFGPPEPVIFRLTGITHLAGQLTLTWETEPGYGYKVERSTDLETWLQGSATRATNQVTLPAGTSPEFFRVVRSP